MRLFSRSHEDMFQCLNRCFFDTQHGRVSLGLERLRDIEDEFPGEAEVAYMEGLIRMKYLGQGIAARELFERAYKLNDKHRFSAFNATKFARTEKEFREWAKISIEISPEDVSIAEFVAYRTNLLIAKEFLMTFHS
jgi:hypothetical protein